MPDTTKDPYATLKLPSGSSIDDVRKQYHRLARIYHPDRNPSDKEWCEEQLKELNAAFALLSNPTKKAAVDSSFSPGASKQATGSQTTSTGYARQAPSPNDEWPKSTPQNSWDHQAHHPKSSGAANARHADPFTGQKAKGSRRRNSTPAVFAVCAAALASIGYIVISNGHVAPSAPTTTSAVTQRHSASSMPDAKPQLVRGHRDQTASRPHVHNKPSAKHKVAAIRSYTPVRTPSSRAAAKRVAKTTSVAHRKPTAPPEVHGAQGTAIALRLAEQAEARGRAIYARKLKRHGISPEGMNLSQMRRAADRSQ